MLQRELDALPAEIEMREQRLADLRKSVADPAFYRLAQAEVQSTLSELQAAESAVDAAIERWAKLESLATSAEQGKPDDP
jgi:ATP-binding cassette subfamily F protein uup